MFSFIKYLATLTDNALSYQYDYLIYLIWSNMLKYMLQISLLNQ